jgi:Uma2 family endonuclease
MGTVARLREEELADRRSKGLDRRDEVWEGVLHMTPAPSLEHQRVLDRIIEFLAPLLRQRGRGTLISSVNVFRDASAAPDYRIPDLAFVASGRERVLQPDGIRGGGPDAVIEIRSPDDETYEKLPFYAALGVAEVIVVQRDSKEPEIFRLGGAEYSPIEPDGDETLLSIALGVRLRRVAGPAARLRIDDASDPSVSVEI